LIDPSRIVLVVETPSLRYGGRGRRRKKRRKKRKRKRRRRKRKRRKKKRAERPLAHSRQGSTRCIPWSAPASLTALGCTLY
jgi:hypothetical protein